jgi:RNA polymerase sigma-70 factor (ECF subfamily)
MIQKPLAPVQSSMTAALSMPLTFDAPRFRRVSQRRLHMASIAASGTAMSDRSEATRPRDQWSDRIGAIATSEDRAAFSDLFVFFAPRVKGYLQRSGAGDAQAEELAQETMVTVWRKARLYDPGHASASTWIFTIARNLRIDALRRERRGGGIRVEDVEAEFEVDGAPLADARLVTLETEARVRMALKALPSDQLRVIEMSFFEERPHGEIARALQIPLGTVKSRVRLAMRRLRGLLDELR